MYSKVNDAMLRVVVDWFYMQIINIIALFLIILIVLLTKGKEIRRVYLNGALSLLETNFALKYLLQLVTQSWLCWK